MTTEYSVEDVRDIIRKEVEALDTLHSTGAKYGGAIKYSKQTGIPHVSISQFLNGKSVGVPASIAEHLGIEKVECPLRYVRKNDNQKKD